MKKRVGVIICICFGVWLNVYAVRPASQSETKVVEAVEKKSRKNNFLEKVALRKLKKHSKKQIPKQQTNKKRYKPNSLLARFINTIFPVLMLVSLLAGIWWISIGSSLLGILALLGVVAFALLWFFIEIKFKEGRHF